MAELSPAEILREAAAELRVPMSPTAIKVAPEVVEPLAEAFEKVAKVVRLDSDFVHRVGYAEMVAVASVLLAAPDGQ